MKVGQRVLFFTFYNDKPIWLVGVIKHVMEEVGHYTIRVRKDYRGLVQGNDQAVVPKQFVFEDIGAADAWLKEVDKDLTKFTSSYDNSEETWEAMTKALTWQPDDQPSPTDVQSSVSGDSQPAVDSDSSSSLQAPCQAP